MNFIFNKIAQLVRLIFVFIFGEVQWKLPAWLRAIVFPFKLIGRKESAIYQKSRLQFYLINVMIVASLSAAAYGYLWYKSLPQPAYVTFSVAAVESTELRADAKPKELSIVFDSSAAKIELVTKTITEEFSSTPKLQAGSWSWRSDRNLVFTPSSEWVVGQKYQVFFPKEIFSKAVLLKDPFFEFEAPRITGSNTDYKFYEDPIDPQLKQAVATFRYSHILNKSEFEKRVRVGLKSGTATEYSQNLSFKVVYNDLGNEATVRSESLKIPDRDSQIEIKISSGVQALSGGVGTESESQAYVNVPGVENYFKVASVDERIISNPESHLAERFVVLNFSTAVRGKDLVSGLELSLLPEKIEEVSEETSGYDYDDYGSVPSACWQSPAEVPQDALVSASSVKFEHTENPEDLSLHSIKFSAPAQRCLLVRLKAGTRSFSGYALSQDRTFLVETGEFDRAVEILAKGSIISATGSRKLSLMGRNQSTLRVKLFRIFPEAINHLVTQTFQTELFETPGFAAYTFGPENISEVFVQDMPLAEVAPGLPQYSSFDFSSYTNKNRDRASGLYVMRVQGFDSVQNSAVGPEATRLVLISDLGLLVKRDNEKKREVYVMSFRERQPVSAAEIEVVGRNGLSVFKTTSDENGRASIPNLEDLDLDKRPTAIVVRANENLSFIPWNQVDRQLNLSRFDTGGLYSNSPVQTLTAYPFSDRGIYRPGEEADFGIVFKDVNWKQFDALPVELSVTNARGTTVLSEKRIVRDPGFESLHLKIGEEYPVGIYNLSVNLLKDSRYQQAYLGSVPFKVEEFLPDRLKVNASLNVEVKQGWVKPKDLVLKSELKNLFGTAAQGNKIKASIRLFPGLPDFSDYPGYSFNDPLLTKNSFDESLGEKLSDLEGKSEFPLNLEKYEQGLFFMRLLVEGFEKEGGRSVLTNLSTVVSPLDYLVGYKADSDLSYLKLGSKHELSLVSIGQDLSLYAVSGLKLEKSRIDYISVLSKQSNGDLAYSSVKKVVPLGEQTINLVDGRATLALDTKAAGEYVYTIFDPSGLKLNSVQFFVAGDGNVSRDLERNAELQIKTARKQYANGEQIEVSIQSPYVGTGLITIEKDHVYAAQWFKADTTTSVQTITVPEGLEGNAYVNVAFVRALDSEEIYMSPLSYGVVPFSISPEKRTVAIELNAPTKIMPGETLKIKVATAETAKVVVFAADEGIHQVGRYQQPDPLAHMYRKRALEVDTIQILDLLMPEYDLLNRSSAAGGDMDALLGKFKNPFKRKGQKPVAYWSGIHEVNGEKEFTYEVPDYFSGNIKIYAVAVNAERIGIAKSETLCQGDLVLQPTAPLAVAPEDVFSVSTTVSNTTDRKQVAVVSLMPSSNIEVLATKEQSVELEPGAEALVTYNVKALNQLGVAELIFKASAGTTSSKYTIDLSIRPASSLVSEVAAGVVSANKSPLVLEVNSNFYPEYQQRTLTVSPVPLAWLNGLARFLDTYPYGCTEQLVSKAFPSIVFSQNA